MKINVQCTYDAKPEVKKRVSGTKFEWFLRIDWRGNRYPNLQDKVFMVGTFDPNLRVASGPRLIFGQPFFLQNPVTHYGDIQ